MSTCNRYCHYISTINFFANLVIIKTIHKCNTIKKNIKIIECLLNHMYVAKTRIYNDTYSIISARIPTNSNAIKCKTLKKICYLDIKKTFKK